MGRLNLKLRPSPKKSLLYQASLISPEIFMQQKNKANEEICEKIKEDLDGFPKIYNNNYS